METKAKILIPNKSWILENRGEKYATVRKEKTGYSFICKGKQYNFQNLEDLKNQLGINLILENALPASEKSIKEIYNFPVNGKVYNPVWDVKKKLPIYSKSSGSKSHFCAGYYAVKFRKGWVKSFCPKLITLERYDFFGPYKTELEAKSKLSSLNKPE